MSLCMPSHILYLLKHKRAYTLKSYSLGKPHPIHAQVIMNHFEDLSKEEIMFVCDTINTDIELAEENGFQSCLVLMGNTDKKTLITLLYSQTM